MANDPFAIAGRRILVTGASRGLGEAIATTLAARGARVILHGRDADRLENVRKRLEVEHHEAASVRGELRDESEASRVVQEAAGAFEGLDGLVNNAGGSFAAPFSRISGNGFNAVVQANLTSCYLVSAHAFDHLAETGGAVVNISSVASLRPAPLLTHYGAAKAAVNHLTRSLAAEWAGRGVRINAVAPGLIATPAALTTNFDDDPARISAAEQRIGVGRLGRPSDVADACHFLLSPASAFVNGAVLVVDGGPPNEYVV